MCWWWSCPEASPAGGWDFTLPRGPPREAVAQRPAMREAGTLGFGCGCACGGGGAARGGKGGRIANFSFPHGSKSAVVLALVLVLPRIRHAGGWNLALPRGQPRGRLGFYVAQRPATREAGTLVLVVVVVVVRRGEAREVQLPPRHLWAPRHRRRGRRRLQVTNYRTITYQAPLPLPCIHWWWCCCCCSCCCCCW